MKNKRIDLRSEAGFTLMELIVVIAIVAILIGLLLPQFSGMTDKANAVSAKSDARSALTALASYTTSVANNSSVTFSETTAQKKMVTSLGLTGNTFQGNNGYDLVGTIGYNLGGSIARIKITKGGLEFIATLDTLKGKITDFACGKSDDRCGELKDEGIVTTVTTTTP